MPANTVETYCALFETAPDATVVVDASGRIVLANSRTEQMFGMPRSELIGQPVELLYQERAGDAWGPCQIFPGKDVSAKGWCTAYQKKA